MFRESYKEKYNRVIFTQNCLAHTFNNVVGDVLNWLLPTEKDRKIIADAINLHLFDEEDEEESREIISGKYYLSIIYLINYLIVKHPIRKIRKLATIFKYQHEHTRFLNSQIKALELKGAMRIKIGKFYLINYFLFVYLFIYLFLSIFFISLFFIYLFININY